MFQKGSYLQNFEMDKIQDLSKWTENKIEGKIKVSGSNLPSFLPPRFYQKRK